MTTYVDLQWVSNKVLPFSVWVSGLDIKFPFYILVFA